MNRGWGQAPRVPEAPSADLAKHHEQAPPGPHRTRLHAVGNQTRLTDYVETRTGQAPQTLTKTSYEGVCTPTRRVSPYKHSVSGWRCRIRGGWVWITWCLALANTAAFGLAFVRCAGIGCEGPTGVT